MLDVPNEALCDGIEFRGAMRRAAHTVAIITVGEGGNRTGFTATSYCSASDSPPTMIICINKVTTACAPIVACRYFGVNLLSCDDRGVADEFAGRTGRHGEERFVGFRWNQECCKAPILEDALVGFICRAGLIYDHGNYFVVTGLVTDILAPRDREPLVYLGGTYRRFDGRANA